MLVLSDIDGLSATLSENISLGVYMELVTDYRLYPSNKLDGVEQLARRFLSSHARVPGVLTKETIATIPVAVFQCPYPAEFGCNGRIKGLLFSNGAVAKLAELSEGGEVREEALHLFVDDRTAKIWGYPSDFYQQGRTNQ